MVLTNASGRVVYSNLAARQTFLGGRKLEGLSFAELLAASPEPLRQAVAGEADTLFTIEGEGESEIYHLSQRAFLLNSQSHRLYLLKQLTRELSRQEVETWKKVIRVIAHELNNSLAPISSLAHSGRQTIERPEPRSSTASFARSRSARKHLHTFIDGYARFAKLPRPQPEEIDWPAFLRSLQETAPFRLAGEPPARPGVFDPTQMEQVLINLVKNAREAGAPARQHRAARAGARGRLAHAGARSRGRDVGGGPAQRLAAVLFDQAGGRRPRADAVPRSDRGARRPDFAGEPPRRRAGGDIVDSGDHAGLAQSLPGC